jgi:hypothetical protein
MTPRNSLRPVPELRVAAAQLLLLLLGQALEAMVPLAGGAHPVLVGAVEDAKDGQQDDGNLATQVDGVAREVPGLVGWYVGPSAGMWLAGWISERGMKEWEAYVATMPPMVPRVTT